MVIITIRLQYPCISRLHLFLWPPCVIGQAIIFLPCGFYLLSSSSFFPRLISASADWMSTILPHMVWPSANLECRSEMCCTRLAENRGRKNRHFGIITQLCPAISSELRHVSTIGKNLLTRMWANAQRDGRPAEHRWRPLFNGAKFG